jgi:hypothetical protein
MKRALRSGALAGVFSTLAFAALHHVLISDIWFSLLPMLLAGALCGLAIAWTYVLLFPRPRVGSWMMYNLLFVGLFAALGAASLALLEPITTVAAVLAGGSPPRELFARALPLTIAFVVGSALLISGLWGRTLPKFAAVLLTSVLLYGLLGMNISILGLVFFASNTWSLVGMFFGLIVALALVYAAVFVILEWRRFATAAGAASRSPVRPKTPASYGA